MHWLEDFDRHIHAAFEEAAQRIRQFPAPLNHEGLNYLNGFDIRVKDGIHNYICYLLPFWLERISSLHLAPERKEHLQQIAQSIAAGNIMGMLHYFIHDDLMDASATATEDNGAALIQNLRRLLPLSELLHAEYTGILSRIAGHRPEYWLYRRQYTYDWARAVQHEQHPGHFMNHIPLITGRASPLRLSAVVMLLEVGLPALLPGILQQLDLALLLLQMNDDAADWPEDLRLHNYNCLLSLIHEDAALRTDHPPEAFYILDEQTVRHYIYDRNILRHYANLAHEQYVSQLAVPADSLDLLQFCEELVQQLDQLAAAIEASRHLLLEQGSLFYYVYPPKLL
ncbi:hypothetical protein [Paenibacillus bovis]|uniref:Uncharacterized protein n=1 Tax=Paenibacillus bovis TaxID=1616788 RepID=A0A172ZFF2_9BACL|nr:hypothetical protein [Paenibacillus bovis]ANF95880.1 hypothetical protein AR543_07590 [Paenibacillus bovis]